MAAETILQHWIFTSFALPFLLIFFVVFALLEKTKIFGDENKQINALVAFVIGLIFVGSVFPKLVVGNLILFLTVALIVVFVGLLIWGFLSGGEAKIEGTGIKIVGGIVTVIVVVLAVIWATDWTGGVLNFLFGQSWSSALWTNVSFIAVIAIALALILKSSK